MPLISKPRCSYTQLTVSCKDAAGVRVDVRQRREAVGPMPQACDTLRQIPVSCE